MPTYEFVCPAGHRFDHFVRKISESVAELPCPECGATAARQLSGGAGLIFKGSGFYITDYGKDGKKAPVAPAKTGDKTDGAPSQGGSTETKKGAPGGAKEASSSGTSQKSTSDGGKSSGGGSTSGGGSLSGGTSKE